MCQRLEGHQVFKTQSGHSHFQPDRRAVIYGPGERPKEDFGKVGGKKGEAQASAHPRVPGGVLGLLEDLVKRIVWKTAQWRGERAAGLEAGWEAQIMSAS